MLEQNIYLTQSSNAKNTTYNQSFFLSYKHY